MLHLLYPCSRNVCFSSFSYHAILWWGGRKGRNESFVYMIIGFPLFYVCVYEITCLIRCQKSFPENEGTYSYFSPLYDILLVIYSIWIHEFLIGNSLIFRFLQRNFIWWLLDIVAFQVMIDFQAAERKRLEEPASEIGLESLCAMVCKIWKSELFIVK